MIGNAYFFLAKSNYLQWIDSDNLVFKTFVFINVNLLKSISTSYSLYIIKHL